MPSATDLYFQTDDNREELPHLRSGKLAEIPTVWGHRGGNPRGIAEETAFLDEQVKALLASGSPRQRPPRPRLAAGDALRAGARGAGLARHARRLVERDRRHA